jgi:hypothetical protein
MVKTIKNKNNQYTLTLSKRKKRANSLKIIRGGAIDENKIKIQFESIINKMIPNKEGKIPLFTPETVGELNDIIKTVKAEIKTQTGISIDGIVVGNLLNAAKNIALTISSLGPIDNELKKIMNEAKKTTGCKISTTEVKDIASKLFSLILSKNIKAENINTKVINKINDILKRPGCKNIVTNLKEVLKNISTQQMSKTLNLGNNDKSIKDKMEKLGNIKPISDQTQNTNRKAKMQSISSIVSSNLTPLTPEKMKKELDEMEKELNEIEKNPEELKNAIKDVYAIQGEQKVSLRRRVLCVVQGFLCHKDLKHC